MLAKIISSYVTIITVLYLWNRWSDDGLKLKSIRTLLYSFVMLLFVMLNYFLNNSLFKFINITIILIIICKYLFKDKLKDVIVYPIFSQMLYFVSETIFVCIIFLIIGDNINDFINNYFGAAISNVSISIIVLLISKIKITNKIVYKLKNYTKGFNELTILLLFISVLYLYSIFAFNIYYKSDPKFLMFISVIISLLGFTMVFYLFKMKSDYYRISEKYNSSLVSLKELEKALTNHRIDNHENKNHLMTIRSMTKNKKVNSFINSILDNKINDDKRIMQETSIIPSGGLRGLIYSKLLLMNSKNIEYELDVSNQVRVINMLDYDDSTILDICKIVGIFIDNAIEEMDNVDDKYVVLELYLEDNVFIISISNTYSHITDKNDIYKPGVSTKGGNHGYGLSLVKKIIQNNDNLKTYNEITEDEFIQVLKIYK